MNRRILMIVTSNARMGSTGQATGLWAEELAVPYYRFVDAGLQVDLASPDGGAAPIDAGSLKPRGENAPLVERWLADEAAQAKLRATTKACDVDASTYDAVFFPGGHGTMWDLPGDAGVKRAVESAYGAGKLVASVCHGAAGLVSARGVDGQPLVKGRRINAFTDDEEAAAGQTETVPFLLESRLRELGALFEGAPNWQSFSVRDGQFITGQNPQSSDRVAHDVLEALGIKPAQARAA
jgi:putative intracellular protease/amidase